MRDSAFKKSAAIRHITVLLGDCGQTNFCFMQFRIVILSPTPTHQMFKICRKAHKIQSGPLPRVAHYLTQYSTRNENCTLERF
jgi:hypothetical protein